MKKQQVPQQKPARPHWHQTLYAYHEAGHAVVGHVIGRCVSEISIVADKGRGYKGYCQFSTYAESAHDLNQWMPGSANPERIAFMYGGTVAMQMICEQRGWNYDRWRGGDVGDLATIYLWSVEIAGEDEAKQHILQRACRSHAQDILENYWGAVEALAEVLAKRRQMWGAEAHQIMQQAIDPTRSDWRMEPGTSMQDFSEGYLGREGENKTNSPGWMF